MNDPVIIAAFRVLHEAEAAVAALKSEGIEGLFRRYNDDVERLCFGAFPNGYDVLVTRADSERGIELLQRLWPDDPQKQPRCSNCGSTDIRTIPRLTIFAIGAVVLVLINFFVRERELFLLVLAILGALLALMKPMRCRSCGAHLA